MELVYQGSKILTIVTFSYYGLFCLLSPSMVAEFERFRLAKLRTLTGSLELLGALGLLVGYFFPPMTIAASGGLSLLMLLGVIARARIHDPLHAMMPALVLFGLTAWICAFAIQAAR